MSTNISDLPMSPQNPQPLVQNPQMQQQISPQMQQIPQQNNVYVPPGPTSLPPRDIPQHTTSHTIDPSTIPSYLPPQGQHYIPDLHYSSMPTNPKHYEISDEFKIPILLFVLYYLFQLPIINQFILRIFPDMLNATGHLTSSGTIFKSILFGAFYYILIKGLIYFS
jgi:hypothetical protein